MHRKRIEFYKHAEIKYFICLSPFPKTTKISVEAVSYLQNILTHYLRFPPRRADKNSWAISLSISSFSPFGVSGKLWAHLLFSKNSLPPFFVFAPGYYRAEVRIFSAPIPTADVNFFSKKNKKYSTPTVRNSNTNRKGKKKNQLGSLCIYFPLFLFFS